MKSFGKWSIALIWIIVLIILVLTLVFLGNILWWLLLRRKRITS